MNYLSNNIVRQVLILMVILLIGVVLFVNLQFFLPSFLGAYTFYVLLRKWMFLLTDKYKWKKSLAALVLMLTSFLVILLPILLLVNMMASKVAWSIEHSNEILTSIEKYVNQYEARFKIEIITDENIRKLTTYSAEMLPKILNATFNTVFTVVMLYFVLYFMLVEGRKMESRFYDWVPLKDENVIRIRKEMNGMVFSNAVGIPLIALIQGLVALLGFVLLGVQEPMFWFVIVCITAMLPVVGAALAYVPLALIFFAEDAPVRGVIMLVYGFGVIGLVDNFARFWLQRKMGDVHPLITAFGVIIGIPIFGFIGLIFGPILISLFLLMIRVYASEFNDGGKGVRQSS
ncbi:MAG: AI-2E family transporter [Pseudobacter sp.]|uniref:AI-2E family transporter n=1 Tax=Pseudobacter sp. TaxID=2045420 RepID=UPI003F81EA3F